MSLHGEYEVVQPQNWRAIFTKSPIGVKVHINLQVRVCTTSYSPLKIPNYDFILYLNLNDIKEKILVQLLWLHFVDVNITWGAYLFDVHLSIE